MFSKHCFYRLYRFSGGESFLRNAAQDFYFLFIDTYI